MKIYLFLLSLLVALGASAQGDNPLLDKARRAYDNGEWASATALYGVACDRTPGLPEAYARRVVASELITDSIGSVAAIEDALNAEIGAEELFRLFRENAFTSGHPEIYPVVLKRARTMISWIARPIDAALLDYYRFRNDPAGTEEYARALLSGLPDDTGYRAILGESLMMQGREDEAIAEYKRILEIDPQNFDALVVLGNYNLDAGHRDLAREYLNRAYSIRPVPAIRQTLEKL